MLEKVTTWLYFPHFSTLTILDFSGSGNKSRMAGSLSTLEMKSAGRRSVVVVVGAVVEVVVLGVAGVPVLSIPAVP